MVVIEARDVWKVYGRFEALKGVSFRVEAGRVVILGPNGSGKSTLLSITCGLRKPTRGALLVDGFEPYRQRRRAFRVTACVFEKPRFPIGVRVADVIEFIGDCVYSNLFLYDLGLDALRDRHLHNLSMGEAQLLALYTAVCKEGVRLLVLDEPFSHLDARRASIIWELLSRWRGVMVSTHSVDEAEALGGYLLVLEDGRLAWSGRVEELVKTRVYEVIHRSGYTSRVESLVEKLGGSVLARLGDRLLVEGLDATRVSKLLDDEAVIGVKRAGVRRFYAGLGAG